jgi:2',3'-cyclic-nucleotide 2'-phosphodiesterase
LSSNVRILFIGDIFGQPGRRIVKDELPNLVGELHPDLILANGENAAAGFGITPPLVEELLDLGIAVLTSGNHIWDKKEIVPYFSEHADGRLLRPANFPDPAPGKGLYVGKTSAGLDFAVINVQGRVFMASLDCPFRTVERTLARIPSHVKIRIVDFHAEATSEKIAMGWFLDGQVTAVLGTHTHIPTADETILPQGTAYITDLGMTGPYESVIGIEKEMVIQKFEADPDTGRAVSIQRILRK